MALRTRLRRAFTRGSSDEGGSLSKTSSKTAKPKKESNKNSNVYQPGEKMPPLKYRRPVNPEHKEKLESFNWTKAWRRKSDQSMYSPMGSRIPSRKNSQTTVGRRSVGDRRKSSRGNDGTCVDSGFEGSIAGDSERPDRVREGSDEEGDVTNVGLSRHPTIDPARKSSSVARRSQSLKSPSMSRPVTSDRARQSGSRSDQPFTQEELELALQRSQLDTTKEESDRSADGTPGHVSPGTIGNARPREGLAAS
jgi:hypothetical protein